MLQLLLLFMAVTVVFQASNMLRGRKVGKSKLTRIQKKIAELEAKEAHKEKASAPSDQSSKDTSSSD